MKLVGAHEIRELLGNPSRQRAYQITSKESFPKPVADLRQGKIWDATQVEKWIAANR